MYPENESIVLSSSARCDTIATYLVGKFGGYRVISSVSPVIGDPYIYVTGNFSKDNVEIGTDYKLGSIGTNHLNKEIDELGSVQYLGTDGFGNKIHEVSKDGGVPTSMPIMLDDGTIEQTSVIERTA
jgi:hypothetical protein